MVHLELESPSPPAVPAFAHAGQLLDAVSPYIRLPHPNVVSALGGAVFPSIRDQKNQLKLATIGDRTLLLDDNTTARWAVLWSHGHGMTSHPRGWTFAHVWARPKDPRAGD